MRTIRKTHTEEAEGLVIRVEYDVDGTPICDVHLEDDPEYGASLLWAMDQDALYRGTNDEDTVDLNRAQRAQIQRWAAKF